MSCAFILHGLSSSRQRGERRRRVCGGLEACVVLLLVVVEGVVVPGVMCWRWRRCVKRWFRESKCILHVRHAKDVEFEAEIERDLGLVFAVFPIGSPSIRYAGWELIWPRVVVGFLAFVVCICSCLCLCPIPCSLPIPPLHTDVAVVEAERSEAVSLLYSLAVPLAEALYANSGAGLMTAVLKPFRMSWSNGGKNVSPETNGAGGAVCLMLNTSGQFGMDFRCSFKAISVGSHSWRLMLHAVHAIKSGMLFVGVWWKPAWAIASADGVLWGQCLKVYSLRLTILRSRLIFGKRLWHVEKASCFCMWTVCWGWHFLQRLAKVNACVDLNAVPSGGFQGVGFRWFWVRFGADSPSMKTANKSVFLRWYGVGDLVGFGAVFGALIGWSLWRNGAVLAGFACCFSGRSLEAFWWKIFLLLRMAT